MRTNAVTTVATYTILVIAGSVAITLPDSLPHTSAVPANTIHIAGTLRDFRRTHVDFDVVPAEGMGHCAGNVEVDLGPHGRPVAAGNLVTVSGSSIDTVAGWGFDEGVGVVAGDEAGVSNGVLRNGASWLPNGKFGNAIEFDGVDDFVEVPHHPVFLLDGVTVAFWFKSANPVPRQGMVSKDSLSYDDGGHFTIFVWDSMVQLRLQSKTASYWIRSPVNSVVPDQWHHLSASFGPAGMKLFLDGVLVDTNAYTGGMGTTSGGGGNYEPWAFGVNTWVSDDFSTNNWIEPFRGALDEVRIFHRQLTETEFTTVGGYKVPTEWRDSNGRPVAPQLYQSAWGGYGGAGPLNILLIVSDPGAMSASESVAQAVFESWGHTVLALDDGSSDAEVDAAVAVNDVVYITPDTDDVLLRPNLIHAPIGIVNANLDVRNEFGWPTGAVDSTSTSIELVDTSHYITSGFGNGTLTLFSSPQDMSATNSPIAGGSALLAIADGGAATNPILQAMDTGSALWNAGRCCAEDRRVQLPWGYAGFDMNAMTDDGLTLLRRSLDWAAHADASVGPCYVVADTAGAAGVTSSAATTSWETFDEWFRDILGTNLSTTHSIILTWNGSEYEYLDDDFHPIDGALYGQDGGANNDFFSYTFAATFTYDQCAGQFVEFAGGDGAWMFIDDRLVLDLGGVQSTVEQYVDLDRLGLDDGEAYEVKFFYAQRNATRSVFRLRTNLVLNSAPGHLPVTSAFD